MQDNGSYNAATVPSPCAHASHHSPATTATTPGSPVLPNCRYPTGHCSKRPSHRHPDIMIPTATAMLPRLRPGQQRNDHDGDHDNRDNREPEATTAMTKRATKTTAATIAMAVMMTARQRR